MASIVKDDFSWARIRASMTEVASGVVMPAILREARRFPSQCKVTRRMRDIRRLLFICLAGVSFSLGVIGLFLPVMPTTCFMLVAVWAASKSSPFNALREGAEPA